MNNDRFRNKIELEANDGTNLIAGGDFSRSTHSLIYFCTAPCLLGKSLRIKTFTSRRSYVVLRTVWYVYPVQMSGRLKSTTCKLFGPLVNPQMPPVTRVYMLLLVVITLMDASVGKVIDMPSLFALDWGKVFKVRFSDWE